MDSLRRVLSFGSSPDDEESGILGRLSEGTSLGWGARVQAFLICFVVSMLFSMISFAFFFTAIGTFAAFYTMGNILGIASTMFLVGPWKQLQNIFAPTRLIASVLVIATFCLTLWAAFGVHSIILALLLVFFQFLALLWYSISYIPFMRDAVKSLFSSLLS